MRCGSRTAPDKLSRSFKTRTHTKDRNPPAFSPPYDYTAEDPCVVVDEMTMLSGPR
jgi:hypothetical protein